MPSLKSRIKHLCRNNALTVHDMQRICKALDLVDYLKQVTPMDYGDGFSNGWNALLRRLNERMEYDCNKQTKGML